MIPGSEGRAGDALGILASCEQQEGASLKTEALCVPCWNVSRMGSECQVACNVSYLEGTGRAGRAGRACRSRILGSAMLASCFWAPLEEP